jgi:multicomponent K+:H+ antiporter subunit A
VFTLVVGATVLMLIAIAHQSVRGHRASPRIVGTHPAPTKVPASAPQHVPAGED